MIFHFPRHAKVTVIKSDASSHGFADARALCGQSRPRVCAPMKNKIVQRKKTVSTRNKFAKIKSSEPIEMLCSCGKSVDIPINIHNFRYLEENVCFPKRSRLLGCPPRFGAPLGFPKPLGQSREENRWKNPSAQESDAFPHLERHVFHTVKFEIHHSYW